MKEYESNIRSLENQLSELERKLAMERRRNGRTPPRTPIAFPNEDDERLRRLRRQLSAEKRIIVALQRLKAGDFYRPRQGQILERMMAHINRYPPSLQKLFSVRECVGEVMGYQPSPSPTVKRAATWSSQRKQQRVVRSDMKQNNAALRHRHYEDEDSKRDTFTPILDHHQRPTVPVSEPPQRSSRYRSNSASRRMNSVCEKAARSSHIYRGRNRARSSQSLLRTITHLTNSVPRSSSEKFSNRYHFSHHESSSSSSSVCKNLEFSKHETASGK